MVRTRIAPSPTGSLHVGTLRAALFNYLFAKSQGGSFALRIEDTDIERSDKKFEKEIFQGFSWLGIIADEGPLEGGPFAPYRQTERIGTYSKYLELLLSQGNAFYCFHSEENLERERKELMAAKRPPIHACEYRSMERAEAEMLLETKGAAIIRFKTPLGKIITFTDLVRGEISFESDLLGDFSLAKGLTAPLYNFAVVVDDYEMQITHVIRGEDHIPNTPKQILIIEALGFLRPQYAHLPLILGSDRSNLSKRHGATSIDEYRKEGYLSDALFNFIALLGWSPGGDREIMTKEEIIKEFSLERVQKSGAIFDVAKLDWMNGEYIRKKSLVELARLCIPYIEDFFKFKIKNSKLKIGDIKKIIALEQPRLKKLSEIGDRADFFFREPVYEKELLQWKSMRTDELSQSLDKSYDLIFNIEFPVSKEAVEKAFFEMIGTGDKGSILWPLRVALTGKKASPGPFEILSILPKEVALKRIAAAKGLLA